MSSTSPTTKFIVTSPPPTSTPWPLYPVGSDRVPFQIYIIIAVLPMVLIVICFVSARKCGMKKVVRERVQNVNIARGQPEIFPPAPPPTFFTVVSTFHDQNSTTIPPLHIEGNFQNSTNNFDPDDPRE
ncbi:unnamed protein product [Orchesella dallaii]|uniref:Transmembrane protein n=1 Tax=Orchesella dallaii TaxID=48710 RepID=A0ABP1PHL0_9HEXA